ncbi:MAG: GntR family transcriptional regulator, partial [Lachnospiraceae bacterium]|nr:GntR family transcriptional regulator [Lachnospiraceae bacterium]
MGKNNEIMQSSEKKRPEEKEPLPQYMRIAADLAARIAAEEFREDTRIPGKSTLSGEYGVSQETVRKAFRLLGDMGILQVKEGCGTIVRSKDAAHAYLETIHRREETLGLRDQLRSLFNDYKLLGRKIMEISDSLIDSVSTPLPSDQALPAYEMVVPESSDKVNMTIGDLRFWQCTGATITAIKRGQSIQISPGPYVTLRAGDVLVYVGSPSSQWAVQQLFTSGRTENTLYRIQEQINTAVHMKELSVVTEVLGARLGDITDFVAMTKGMTNHSYLFSCKGARYILRIPGEGTVNLIDRKQESDVYRAIAGTGLCDDAVYLNPQNGLKVTRFLEGVRTCDPFNEEDLVKCMELLRRFHGIRLQVNHTFDIFGNIDYYESLWGGAPSEHSDYKKLKEKVFS